jgi:hypothetical protein
MTAPARNRGPFSQARQEHEARRSYFLPDTFAEVELDQPVYLIGTRGAGKTTFLRALTWSERLENASLQRQLLARDRELFAGCYVGVYMKLPKSQLYVFDRWIPETDRDRQLYSDFVGLHLSLSWSELMCGAVAGLVERGIVDVDVEAERAAVQDLSTEYSEAAFFESLDPTRVRTLRAASRGFREIRRTLERRAKALRPLNEVVEEFPVERLAAVAQFVAGRLAKLLGDVPSPWSFKVCVDEAESMSDRQIVVMNSIVRNSEWPLMPVIAWVSLGEWANTTDSSLTVGRPDVRDVPLDNLSDGEFRRFVEGVASVRVQDSVGDDISVDLGRVLGPLDINGLLAKIIAKSSARWGRKLLEDAKANADQPYFRDAHSDALPIYQTYLVQRLRLDVPEPDTPGWMRRGQHSAEIRKKIVAAYLSICSELRTAPWYASADMVIQMSDGCVRDFLWQMDELWEERRVSISRFVTEPISDERQDRALKRASEQKMARIAGLVLTEPRRAERLVDGLATLTAELQRPRRELSESGAAHLRSPEPGYWVLPDMEGRSTAFSERDQVDLPGIYRLVRDAAEAGYLRMESKPHSRWRFRVHTSLAPFYGFSYRGAQYQVKLGPEDLLEFCEAVNEPDRKRVAALLYQRLRGGDISLLGREVGDD